MEDWFIPYQACELPPARKVLILAPHPDDEIFGCGGAVALLQQRGASIGVVVLTDGAGLVSDDQRLAITQTRQAETNAALAALGLSAAQFWGLPDRSLVNDDQCARRLETLVQGVDLVFAPSLTEIHPDHAATGQALLSALQSLMVQGASLPDVLLYEVGSPLVPNFLLDITPVWPAKKQAMRCFASQHITQDYARHIEGLNTFRTYTLKADVQYAEAYHFIPAAELKERLAQSAFPTRMNVRDAFRADSLLRAAEASASSMHRQLMAAQREHAPAGDADPGHRDQAMAQLRATIAGLEQAQRALLNSRSWRLTSPLRWIAERLFRRP